MKLKVIEIEASVSELNASRSLADTVTSYLRGLFVPRYEAEPDDDESEQEDQE